MANPLFLLWLLWQFQTNFRIDVFHFKRLDLIKNLDEYCKSRLFIVTNCSLIWQFHFRLWRNSGSILFVLQNSEHLWTVEDFGIYSICTSKFLTFSDDGGIQDLFYLYYKIPDIFGRCRNVGSILFVLQNSRHFWTVEDFQDLFSLCCKIFDNFGRPGLFFKVLHDFFMTCSGTFWNVAGCFGAFWHVLAHFWTYLNVLLCCVVIGKQTLVWAGLSSNLFKAWCNKTNLLHHYFQTSFNLF